jgi:hypothetical protein
MRPRETLLLVILGCTVIIGLLRWLTGTSLLVKTSLAPDVDSASEATFSWDVPASFPPGEYPLVVQARDSDGDVVNKIITITVTAP